jgi:hypothetical protein
MTTTAIHALTARPRRRAPVWISIVNTCTAAAALWFYALPSGSTYLVVLYALLLVVSAVTVWALASNRPRIVQTLLGVLELASRGCGLGAGVLVGSGGDGGGRRFRGRLVPGLDQAVGQRRPGSGLEPRLVELLGLLVQPVAVAPVSGGDGVLVGFGQRPEPCRSLGQRLEQGRLLRLDHEREPDLLHGMVWGEAGMDAFTLHNGDRRTRQALADQGMHRFRQRLALVHE